MKYYRINHSLIEAEVGSTYPQSQTSRHTFHVDDPMYIGKQDIGKRLPKDVLIPEPVLHSKARLTDLISSSNSFRLIISKKLKTLLGTHISNDETEFFPVTVHYRDKSNPYWILNPIVFRMDLINYATAEIWLVGLGGTKLKKMEIVDYNDYVRYVNTLVLPERASIYNFSFAKQTDLDFIQLRNVYGGIGHYVSEKLKSEIQAAGCTGIQFEEVKT